MWQSMMQFSEQLHESTPNFFHDIRINEQLADKMGSATRNLFILVFCLILGFIEAHNIQLKSHGLECFHENLHADDKMTVSFQVGDREFGGSGNLDIDFWVSHPILLSSVHSRRTT